MIWSWVQVSVWFPHSGSHNRHSFTLSARSTAVTWNMSYATSNAFIIINHEDAFFAATDMLFLIRNTERAQYLYFATQHRWRNTWEQGWHSGGFQTKHLSSMGLTSTSLGCLPRQSEQPQSACNTGRQGCPGAGTAHRPLLSGAAIRSEQGTPVQSSPPLSMQGRNLRAPLCLKLIWASSVSTKTEDKFYEMMTME